MINKKIIVGSLLAVGFSIAITYFLIKNKNKVKDIKSILFIGDSNTAANYSYADQLKKMYPNLIIKKISKVGEKTDWMKTQLENELNNNKYDAVAILGGSNDIYALGKTDSLKSNLDEMYKMIHDKRAMVIGITPPNKDFYVNKTTQKQNLLSDLVNWMKKDNNIDYLFDFHNITADKKYFSSSDGYLHANSAAHKILADEIKQKINLV